MSQNSETVTFHLTCAQPRAWVVLTSDHRLPTVEEMHETRPGDWSASVSLPAGDYHRRYYGGDDHQVTYVDAEPTDGGDNSQMDAPFSVKPPLVDCLFPLVPPL